MSLSQKEYARAILDLTGSTGEQAYPVGEVPIARQKGHPPQPQIPQPKSRRVPTRNQVSNSPSSKTVSTNRAAAQPPHLHRGNRHVPPGAYHVSPAACQPSLQQESLSSETVPPEYPPPQTRQAPRVVLDDGFVEEQRAEPPSEMAAAALGQNPKNSESQLPRQQRWYWILAMILVLMAVAVVATVLGILLLGNDEGETTLAASNTPNEERIIPGTYECEVHPICREKDNHYWPPTTTNNSTTISSSDNATTLADLFGV
mmetsp:Transcript_12162/g.25166  ORF Transcript_12162/g.25166 Transcript_12162/m.25166 type:complete len:259 (-) Transcript_12162:449-1225(-)